MIERERLITMVCDLQKGDPDAATKLYETFQGDIYYFILKTVNNDRDLAEDLTQDTFVEILETIGQLQEPTAFVTWSKQIAYHKCTAYFRKRKELLVDEDEDGYSVFDTVEEDREEFIPDAALDHEDLKRTIMKMIDNLPEEQKSAILLRYFNEISVKDIADIQGVTEGTVKSRLNYGRKSIKQAVEDYEKKNDVKLHCAGVIPLLLWLFKNYRVQKKLPISSNTAAQTFVITRESAKIAAVAGAKIGGAALAIKIFGGIAVAAVVFGVIFSGIAAIRGNSENTAASRAPSLETVETNAPFCDHVWAETADGRTCKLCSAVEHLPTDDQETHEVTDPAEFSSEPTAETAPAPTEPIAPSETAQPTEPAEKTETTAPTEPENTQPATEETEVPATLPTSFPAVWQGDGTIGSGTTTKRHYELTIWEMTETYIRGYLIVLKPGETADETDFSKANVASTNFAGTGVRSGNTIVYTVTFDTPVSVGVVPVYTYAQMDLLYSQETNTFLFDSQYHVTMVKIG